MYNTKSLKVDVTQVISIHLVMKVSKPTVIQHIVITQMVGKPKLLLPLKKMLNLKIVIFLIGVHIGKRQLYLNLTTNKTTLFKWKTFTKYMNNVKLIVIPWGQMETLLEVNLTMTQEWFLKDVIQNILIYLNFRKNQWLQNSLWLFI